MGVRADHGLAGVNFSGAANSPGMARGEPTKPIGHARAGEQALTVHCLGIGCYHQAVEAFEELKLWNDMIFVQVSKKFRLFANFGQTEARSPGPGTYVEAYWLRLNPVAYQSLCHAQQHHGRA